MKIEVKKFQDHNEYLFDILGFGDFINEIDKYKYQALIIENNKVQHIELGATKQEAKTKARRWINGQSR